MAEPICEDDGILQEWSPETKLLQQIPLKAQRGLFSYDLNLTCVDVVSEYIVLGTNCGIVYWYCRENGELQRLRFENSNSAVTCVKVVSTVDFMVAAGTEHGTITVFQIPKQPPESIPDVLKPKNKQVERFTIDGLHNARITAIEWSQNGMKLFSGDRNGLVVLTEIDFYMHLSKSAELLNEQFEIVQLSYCQKILLISTTYRSIICDGNDKWKVHQLGTKERKRLGKFGATFYKHDHKLVIYASRPSHRLWLADKSGTVQQTLIFKSAVPSTYPKIQLINPVNKIEPYDTNFGKLIQFGDKKLIAYNSEVLYILHAGAISIVSCLDCARKILDVAVNKDEIYVLEGERSLLRISHLPDKYLIDMKSPQSQRRTSFIFDEFAKIKGTAVGSIKKITSDLIVTPEQISPPALADEAVELPPIVNLPVGSVPSIIPEKDIEISVSVEDTMSKSVDTYNRIPFLKFSKVTSEVSAASPKDVDQQFSEEVISRPVRRRNPKKMKSPLNSQGQESESDTTSTTSEDCLVWGTSNDTCISEESPTSISQSQSSFSVLRDIPSLLTSNDKQEKNERNAQTPEDESQASVDTCESVSERLVLTPEKFLEEQEKTFIRLANQDVSLLDSYNSEKTDNMSVSLNMTPSSSVSSKISENLQSNSEISENVSMKTDDESLNSDNSQKEYLPLPKHLCFYKPENEVSECDVSSSQETSLSSGNSQHASTSKCFKNDKSSSFLEKAQNLDLPCDILPDCRSEEAIQEDVKNNEMILSQILGMDLTTFDQGKNLDGSNKERKEEESSDVPVTDESYSRSASNDIYGKSTERIPESDSHLGIRDDDYSHSELNFYVRNNVNELLSDDLTQFNEKDVTFENTKKDYGKKSLDMMEKRFASLGPLSYGPPSGSSTISSSHPSLDYPSVSANNIPTSAQVSLVEQSDHWLQYKSHEPIISLAVSNNYVVCTDMNEQVYYSELSGLSLTWNLLDYKASLVSVSSDGNIVWILNKKSIYALANPPKKGPFSENLLEATWNVRSFAVDNVNREGWIVKLDGQIKVQRNLVRAPCGKTEDVFCPWLVTNVACWNGCVLAITSDEEVICKPPNEIEFRNLKTPAAVTSVSMGPYGLAWIVDDRSNIYFSDDFLTDDPHWWQILISDYIFQHSHSAFQNLHSKIRLNNLKANIQLKFTMVASNDNSVWIFDKYSSFINVNKTDFTGYLWSEISLNTSMSNIKWESICAEGIFENKGHLWLLSANGDLFSAEPNSRRFQSIPSPCEDPVLCVASSTDTLWVLSSEGKIFSRLGLTEHNLTGNSWRELNLPRIADLRLTWISCGCDVAWGCDVTGRVFITIGSPHHMATNIFDAAWLEVEGKAKEGARFEKVFVGPHFHMVWAIDNGRNIYVREGIFPHLPIGTDWVYVSGIEATHLTVSGSSVWALSVNGSIYRRFGVSEKNYIGDYWKRIPGSLQRLTSSFTEELWGIDNGGVVVRLGQKTVFLTKKKATERNNESIGDEGDWEVVQ